MRKLVGLICFLASYVYLPTCQAAMEDPQALLPAEQAFLFMPTLDKGNNLDLYWQIAPGYYLYQDQLKIITANNVSLLNNYQLPPGIEVNDQVLGKSTLYTNKLLINLPQYDQLLVIYQGCAQNGFCYAPIHKLVKIQNNKLQVEDTQLSKFTTKLNLLVFFGLGILLTFTPCVFPMIPLVINLIVGANAISKFKAFILATIYVFGMACSYTTLGILTGMLGAKFQAWLQQPLIIGLFCAALGVLALMQFGVLNFRLPHVNKLMHHWGAKQQGGSLIGAFILGVLSAFIVSPCLTPPLIGILTYISQGGSALVGGLSLLTLSIGMGAPLIIVALLSSAFLPVAGNWMHAIKIAAGISLIALALWLSQGLIPTKSTSNLPWKHINNIKELNQQLDAAKSKQKYTILEVYAAWCASCRKIEQGVLADPKIQAKLANVNLLKIDITDINEQEQQLLDYLQVYGPPTFLFFNPNGQEIKDQRIIGNTNKQQILDTIRS